MTALDSDQREQFLYELDAIAAHLYGLTEDQLIHIFKTYRLKGLLFKIGKYSQILSSVFTLKMSKQDIKLPSIIDNQNENTLANVLVDP